MKTAIVHASSQSDQPSVLGAPVKTALKVSAVLAASLVLANCGSFKSGFFPSEYGSSASPKVVSAGERVPVGGGYRKIGKPYIIAGRLYQPSDPAHYSETGLASWYGEDFHGRSTANGEVFNSFSVSAAHPTLPMPSYVRVTNLDNGRSIIARVNDRGPFHSNRLLDVSERVAEALAFRNAGTAKVKVDYLGKAPQEGSDDAQLIATLTTDGTPAALKGNASASLMTANVEPARLPLQASEFLPATPATATAPDQAPATVSSTSMPALQPAIPVAPSKASSSLAIPTPPDRILARSIATSVATKPAQPAVAPSKPVASAMPVVAPQGAKPQVLSLKAGAPAAANSFKTAQAGVPVPEARPAQGLFYAPKIVPTSALPVKRLTPQTFVPVTQPQTF